MAKVDPTSRQNPQQSRSQKRRLNLLQWWMGIDGNVATTTSWQQLINQAWTKWQRVRKTRWDWRMTTKQKLRDKERNTNFDSHATGKFLQQTMKTHMPTLKITSAMKMENGRRVLSNNRADVEIALQNMLDKWVPQEEKTVRPRHLDTWSTDDESDLPRFVKEIILPDIGQPDFTDEVFMEKDTCTWDSYNYDENMQRSCALADIP